MPWLDGGKYLWISSSQFSMIHRQISDRQIRIFTCLFPHCQTTLREYSFFTLPPSTENLELSVCQFWFMTYIFTYYWRRWRPDLSTFVEFHLQKISYKLYDKHYCLNYYLAVKNSTGEDIVLDYQDTLSLPVITWLFPVQPCCRTYVKRTASSRDLKIVIYFLCWLINRDPPIALLLFFYFS